MSDPIPRERTHLLIRTPGAESRIACGRRLRECVYFVSSVRYVDCEACLRVESLAGGDGSRGGYDNGYDDKWGEQ